MAEDRQTVAGIRTRQFLQNRGELSRTGQFLVPRITGRGARNFRGNVSRARAAIAGTNRRERRRAGELNPLTGAAALRPLRRRRR